MYVGIALPPRSGARLYSRFLVDVQDRGAEHEDRSQHEQREERRDAQRLIAQLAQREEQDETCQEDGDEQRRERTQRVDVVGPGELNASPQGVEKAATLDKRRRNRKAEEREPGDRHEVDPREVPEEPRQEDRQEGDEAGGQRDAHVTAATDRPHQGNRTTVGRGEDEWTDSDVEDGAHRPIQLAVRNAENRRPDAEGERGPEA